MTRPSLAVLCDPPDERWYAMDLAGEKLVESLRSNHASAVDVETFTIPIARIARRVPRLRERPLAFNVDRIAARYVSFPARAFQARRRFDYFHVVDHSYAQLVHALVPSRTGVYCHDLDTFRCLADPAAEPRPAWFRALVHVTLRGLQSAAVVFHSTQVMREQIERLGWLPSSKLVHAPLGVSPEYDAIPREDDGAREVLAPLGGRRFVLHVGSSIPRKRLDTLFEVFARLHRKDPELRLVQQGAKLTEEQRALARSLGIEGAMMQPAYIEDRRVIAGIYRRAAAMLLPSEAEGFGIPVIEALACGTPVVTSDIPVLREVGGGVALTAPVGDAAAWAAIVSRVLDGSLAPPPREARLAHAAKFRWARHAQIILDAYLALGAGGGGGGGEA